jgi:hypothetical protein
MKGIVHKKEDNWFVRYKKPNSKTISEVNCLVELWEIVELPLQLDNSILTEGQEVEFDIMFANSYGSISKVGGYDFNNLVAVLSK